MKIILCDTAFNINLEAPREPPLGLSSIASFLRLNGHIVKVLSPYLEKWNINESARKIYKWNPEIVGFSIIDKNAVNAIKLIKKLRKLSYKGYIVLGGYWPSLNSYEILKTFKEVDACVRGEGEFTLLELTESLNSQKDFKNILGLSYRDGSNIIENKNRPLIENLDELPFPARDYTSQVIKLGSAPAIYTGKGCHGSCSFCSIKAFYKEIPGEKIRTRTHKNIIDEMESLVRNFSLPHFTIIDDNFIFPGKKGAEFVELFKGELSKRKFKLNFDLMCRVDLIEREIFSKLKSVGLNRVFIGVESGHQNGLKRFNKKITVAKSIEAINTLQNLGLEFTVALILSDPWTNYEEFETNLKFMRKIKDSFDRSKLILSVSPRIVVHKYTAIYEKLKEEGKLLGDWFKGYTYEIDNDIKFPLKLWELFTKKWPKVFRSFVLKLQNN
jgi:radical SAM superfamily enzyme YgiQ (UPF0313 family)